MYPVCLFSWKLKALMKEEALGVDTVSLEIFSTSCRWVTLTQLCPMALYGGNEILDQLFYCETLVR